MGCDIHLHAEKRDPVTGIWHLIGNVKREDFGDGDTGIYHEGPIFYNGRNYDLFSILADVRNGRGFAGVKTGEGFSPISNPRGIPEDSSDDSRELLERYGADGHSHSYHALRELLDYDWTRTTRKQGWCNLREWSSWHKVNGQGPSSYSGGIYGPNVEKIPAGEMDKLVEELRSLPYGDPDDFFKKNAGKYALAEWETPYYVAASEFLSTTVPKLLTEAGGASGIDDIRIVFFFDN